MVKKKRKTKKEEKAAKDSVKKKAKKEGKATKKKAEKSKKDKAGKTKATASSKQTTKISREQRLEMIRTAAYYLAQKRGYLGDSEQDDWMLAEEEIDNIIDRTED